MESKFYKRDFIDRTRKIIDQYEHYVMLDVQDVPTEKEQYDATLLINCLLGLLVVTDQHWFEKLPTNEPIKRLDHWGLEADHIRNFGNGVCSADEFNLRELVHKMRNCIAHFNIDVSGDGKKITHVEFSNRSKFKAKIPVRNLEIFAKRLAESVIDTINEGDSKKS